MGRSKGRKLADRLASLRKQQKGKSDKLDRIALPSPDWSRSDKATEHVARRNSIEEAVAEIWGDVLGIDEDEVEPDDDFFDLGGHSLLATQVVVRIEETFGVRLEVRVLFESSSLAGLSSELERPLERELGKKAPDELKGE